MSVPSFSTKPGVEKVAKKPGVVLTATKGKDPKGYNLDVSENTRAAKKAAAEKLAQEQAAAKAEAAAAAKAAKVEGKSRNI